MALDLTQLCDALHIPAPRAPSADDRIHIHRLDTLARADAATLCFAESASQYDAVAASAAAAVLVPEDFPDTIGPLLLRVAEPRNAFFAIAEQFVEPPANSGIHAAAVIADDAVLGDDLVVGACAVIASGAQIGRGCVIGEGSFIAPGVIIGDDCLIEPNATLLGGTQIGRRCIIHAGATIGADGFGFRWDGQRHRKVPQIGCVVIEDDVEIGCNTCVDRATLGVTRIGRGSKIDNLVQVAHNADLGEHVIMAGQAGIAGSSRIGSGTVVGGQVAISDHVQVGAGARIGGQAGVTKDVDDGATVFGTPARPIRETLRELGALPKLPGLLKRLHQQEQELEALKARLAAIEARAQT